MFILRQIKITLVLIILCHSSCKKDEVLPQNEVQVLSNPGIGLATFHKLNNDLPLDQHPESSVAYYRFYWRDYEPTDDNFQDAELFKLLASAAEKNQTVGIRLMGFGDNERIPDWLKGKVQEFTFSKSNVASNYYPDQNDVDYILEINEAVAHFASIADGDLRLNHVEIGSAGFYGEWHMSEAEDEGAKMPTIENQNLLIDQYFNSFKKTPIIALIGEPNDGALPLKYAANLGAGWRADCLGDGHWNGKSWNHMDHFYPQHIAKSNIQ